MIDLEYKIKMLFGKYHGKRERSPYTKKLCVRVSYCEEIAEVNLHAVQCGGLALDNHATWSMSLSAPGKYD